MVKPIIKILIPKGISESFLHVADCLSDLGLSMVSPVSQKIVSWDDNGDQILLGNFEFFNILKKDSQGNLQFWRSDSEDVFVQWQKVPEGSECFIYLDGLDVNMQKMLISKFLDLILMRLRENYSNSIALNILFD